MFNRLRAATFAVLSVLAAQVCAAPVTLDVTGWKGGGAEPANMAALIAKFEKENPDIKVKFEYMSRNDTTTVVSSRLQGGNGPDVLMIDRELMRQWQGAHQLLDLSGEKWVPTIWRGVRNHTQVGGKTYMLPMELVGIGLFANLDLFKRAGIATVPTDVDQLKAACGKLAAAGITPMLLPAKEGWAPAALVIASGLAAGGGDADARAESFVGAGSARFAADPAFKQSMAALKVLADAKCFVPRLNNGVSAWSTGLTEFQAGRVAMMPQGAWNIAKFSATKGLSFQFAPLPALVPGNGPVALDMLGTAWAINAASHQADAAKKWLAFWARPDNDRQFLDAEAGFSPFEGGTDAMPPQAQPYAAAQKNGHVVLYPKGVWTGTLFTAIWNSMSAYFLDIGQDPAKLLARWDAAAR
ncbi:family 1 extracellular solute-binding protein [Burkholderia lata]|uniref:Family 1 extracellular solute-binding protein n=1 Tax=Burkholderia lata (strain ATCC 17760 / DSM 23089 / LMG 22485 / NCIMB 9086 / R18194 / 383) TaxID=482957 RepID=A0A6P2XCI6_BURL3|nr:ABC transporter substrate-binding protein [Burkholderia lata]VWD06005.1 family 1 extracellular solute-binding protein [Burkholderia lata]